VNDSAYRATLNAARLILVKGGRRDYFVIVDRHGQVISMTRQPHSDQSV
jgi:hypothetical protein